MPFQGKGLIDFDKKAICFKSRSRAFGAYQGIGAHPKNKKTVRIPLMRNGRFFASVITLALLAGF